MRPLARYAVPIAWMNAVGDDVGRIPSGRSLPRGASAPPHTVMVGSTAFSASYVCARSERYAGAEAFEPSGANCGSQKRFRFGSLPTMTWSKLGSNRATDAAYCANWACAVASRGVVRWPTL